MRHEGLAEGAGRTLAVLLLAAALASAGACAGQNQSTNDRSPAHGGAAPAPPTPPTPPTPPVAPIPPTPPTPPTPPAPAAAPVPPIPPAPPAAAAAPAGPVGIFPHVRVDRLARVVEVDAFVGFEFHDPQTPVTYLEVVACTPDSKEHESLVVTRAKPSHVHAALLLIGLTPGAPGRVVWDGQAMRRVQPRGDAVAVRFRVAGREVPPQEWITTQRGGRLPAGRFVFAGSGERTLDDGQGPRRVYEADMAGTFIGLTTFGSECIAWSDVLSPDSTIDAPEWIVDLKTAPTLGSPVVIVLRPE